MPVFTKKLDFYLDALKINSEKVMGGLDDEISTSMREMEHRQKLNLEKIKSLMERFSLSEEEF